MFGSPAARFSMYSSVWSKWVNSWDLTILKTIAAGVHFSGRHSTAILLKGVLLFSFLSLLPNDKNTEVQPEGLSYLWLIHFTMRSILFISNISEEARQIRFSGHILMWLFSTESINKWLFLFEENSQVISVNFSNYMQKAHIWSHWDNPYQYLERMTGILIFPKGRRFR